MRTSLSTGPTPTIPLFPKPRLHQPHPPPAYRYQFQIAAILSSPAQRVAAIAPGTIAMWNDAPDDLPPCISAINDLATFFFFFFFWGFFFFVFVFFQHGGVTFQ